MYGCSSPKIGRRGRKCFQSIEAEKTPLTRRPSALNLVSELSGCFCLSSSLTSFMHGRKRINAFPLAAATVGQKSIIHSLIFSMIHSLYY